MWSQALVLANNALVAPDCGQVLERAREIVNLLGLDKADENMSGDDKQMLGNMQSNMTGSRSSPPLPNPIKDNENPESGGASGVNEDKSDGGVNSQTDTQNDNGINNPHLLHSPAEDIEKMMERAARELSEDLDSLVPQDNADCPLVAKAKSWGGRDYPDIVAFPYPNRTFSIFIRPDSRLAYDSDLFRYDLYTTSLGFIQ